jgi:hypothetical protein
MKKLITALLTVAVILTIMVVPVSAAGINDGLIMYYTFDNDASTDSSGKGNNAEVLGEAIPVVDGKINKAAQFNGVDNVLRVFDVGSYEQLTVSYWVKISRFPTDFFTMFAGDEWSTPGTYHLHILPSEYLAFGQVDGSLDVTTGQTEVPLDEWVFVTVTNDTVEGKIVTYVNGEYDIDGVDADGMAPAWLDALTIGGWTSGGNPQRFFEGLLDDYRVYDRVLSADEVKELMNADIAAAAAPAPAAVEEEAPVEKGEADPAPVPSAETAETSDVPAVPAAPETGDFGTTIAALALAATIFAAKKAKRSI